MKHAISVAVLGFCLSAAAASAQSAITEQQAHAIGVDAYLYFYPLITMDLTRKQFTNIEAGQEPGRGPMNTFQSMSAYPSAADKGVVRYNFDTLYSAAWLDMTKEPTVVSVPDTNGRYYLLPMLDMWTDVLHRRAGEPRGLRQATFS